MHKSGKYRDNPLSAKKFASPQSEAESDEHSHSVYANDQSIQQSPWPQTEITTNGLLNATPRNFAR